MERLKRLYMYSEDSISEQEYITERNRISEAYEDIEMRLSEISTCERTDASGCAFSPRYTPNSFSLST